MSNETDTERKLNRLREVANLSVEEGLKNTGGETAFFLEIAENYAFSVKKQADKVEQFLMQKDYKNYTILVHAIKSSSRLIGALELSQMALDLETAGNALDIAVIERDTPAFLDMYRELGDALEFLTVTEQDEDLPEIDESMLREAVAVMKDGAESFDLMMVESVMDQLRAYRLPDAFLPTFERLKQALADVEYDEIIDLLESFG